MTIHKTNFTIDFYQWAYAHCLEYNFDYETIITIAQIAKNMSWQPHDIKLDLKSLLLK